MALLDIVVDSAQGATPVLLVDRAPALPLGTVTSDSPAVQISSATVSSETVSFFIL